VPAADVGHRYPFSPPDVAAVFHHESLGRHHRQPSDDDVTTTTSGSYVIDMAPHSALEEDDWRHQTVVADSNDGVVV